MSEMPVILQVDPKSRVDYRFQITPQTILVNGSGKVEKAWSGVLDDTAVAEIERFASGNKTVSENSRQ
jgi:hypothetical protein